MRMEFFEKPLRENKNLLRDVEGYAKRLLKHHVLKPEVNDTKQARHAKPPKRARQNKIRFWFVSQGSAVLVVSVYFSFSRWYCFVLFFWFKCRTGLYNTIATTIASESHVRLISLTVLVTYCNSNFPSSWLNKIFGWRHLQIAEVLCFSKADDGGATTMLRYCSFVMYQITL